MPNMIQLFSCRCEPKARNLCHLTSKVQRLLPKALSQTHVCSSLKWISRYFKRKAQLSSWQSWNANHFWICNSLQNTLSFQLANLKSRRNDPSAWKQNDMILETYAPESCVNHQSSAKIDIQPPSRSWTRRCGQMRSCHPRGIGHRRRWTIVVSRCGKRWKTISRNRHVAFTRHRRHRSPQGWGHTPLVVPDSMEHFHSWLLFLPTKMPFVDLSLLLSPSYSSFVSGCWYFTRLGSTGTGFGGPSAGLFVPITPSKLFTALVTSSATEARSAGYLSRISAKFRFTVAIKLPPLMLTFPDSPSFPPVLNSSAVHCRSVQDLTILLMPFLMCRKYTFWESSFSSIWRCLSSVSVPPSLDCL